MYLFHVMYTSVFPFLVCMYIMSGPVVHGGQKKEMDPQKLLLSTVLSHCVGARTELRSRAGAVSVHNC